MPNLYIIEQGARLEIEADRLIVTAGDDVIASVPARRVNDVVIVGHVGVTTPALGVLLDRGIGLLLLSYSGAYRGRLVGDQSRNVAVRQMQYRRADDDAFGLALGKAVVEGKIRNARTLLMRLDEEEAPAMVRITDGMKRFIDQLPEVRDRSALLGLEGEAARLYYRGLRDKIAAPWRFERRARRPPPDPVNALLSIAYTFLHQSCASALEAAGLDPMIGFYHVPAYGRASLASDLMEEFRAVIADSVVLTLLNKRMVTAGDFASTHGGNGVTMGHDAWRVVTHQYTHRLGTTVRPPGMTRSLSYQKVLEVQARAIRCAIEGSKRFFLWTVPRQGERRCSDGDLPHLVGNPASEHRVRTGRVRGSSHGWDAPY